MVGRTEFALVFLENALIAKFFVVVVIKRMEGGGTEEFFFVVGLEFGGHFFLVGNLALKVPYTRLINKIKLFSTLFSMDSIADLYKRTSYFFGRFSRSTVATVFVYVLN